MSRAGQGGVVAIWNGIAEEARDEFYRWHETEHMPERLAIPGFLRGRRYRVVGEGIEFFTRYDVESPAVLTSEAYLARLNAPTEWTKRVLPHFRDTARALCLPVGDRSRHSRTWLVTLRVFGEVGEAEMTRRMHASASANVEAGASVELLKIDDAASAIETAERISRPGDARNSRWIILAEAPDEWGAKQALAHFQTQFAEISIESAIYVLEYDISAAAGFLDPCALAPSLVP